MGYFGDQITLWLKMSYAQKTTCCNTKLTGVFLLFMSLHVNGSFAIILCQLRQNVNGQTVRDALLKIKANNVSIYFLAYLIVLYKEMINILFHLSRVYLISASRGQLRDTDTNN